MKKYIQYSLISFFLLGTLFSMGYIMKSDTIQSKVELSKNAHADWPEKSFDELVLDADIIGVVKVKGTEKKLVKGQGGEVFNRQFSKLDVQRVIKGEKIKDITLNQAIDYVSKNGKYLMFLTKGTEGYYYELTNLAIVPEKEGKFSSGIKGLKGLYSEENIISAIERKKSSLLGNKTDW